VVCVLRRLSRESITPPQVVSLSLAMSWSVRFPWISIFASSASICANPASVRSTSAAPGGCSLG
jgi:hypothetical protein